jgi:hypothetical protein
MQSEEPCRCSCRDQAEAEAHAILYDELTDAPYEAVTEDPVDAYPDLDEEAQNAFQNALNAIGGNLGRTFDAAAPLAANFALGAVPGALTGAVAGGGVASLPGALLGGVAGGATSLGAYMSTPAGNAAMGRVVRSVSAPPARRPAPRPRVARPPAPRAPAPPTHIPGPMPQRPVAPVRPVPGPRPGAIGPAAAARAASQLLELVQEPRFLMAVAALAAGGRGRPTIPVGDSEIPTVAFVDLARALCHDLLRARGSDWLDGALVHRTAGYGGAP